ncbi:unnamed protein product, partial [Iphiclides podalirius]
MGTIAAAEVATTGISCVAEGDALAGAEGAGDDGEANAGSPIPDRLGARDQTKSSTKRGLRVLMTSKAMPDRVSHTGQARSEGPDEEQHKEGLSV